jgi:hypothetical protein
MGPKFGFMIPIKVECVLEYVVSSSYNGFHFTSAS